MSGIFLPTSATSNLLPEATMITVGPGVLDKEGRPGRVVLTAVKVGDQVLLPGWGGNCHDTTDCGLTRLESFLD